MSEKIKVVGVDNMPEVRGMTRKQAKEFNDKGLNPFRNASVMKTKRGDDTTVDDTLVIVNLSEDMNEWILSTVYPDYDFDEADKGASDILAAKTFKKAFAPATDEVKNS